jgi:FkbM family methyltransferase
MSLSTDLVIDVGMHNGDDTAYYLHRGFRVVAIEANPHLAARGAQRFADAMRSGRLRILPVGIAAERGEAEFYIAPDLDVLSSFNLDLVQRADTPIERVRVPCLPIRDVLAAHGVPWYLKVDIEGNDSLCIAGLDGQQLPACVSIELDLRHGDADLRALHALGYTRFKCIRQNDLREMTPAILAGQLALRRRAARPGPWGTINRVLRGLSHRAQSRRCGDWTFPPGSSGPFGDDLAAPWLDAAQALDLWAQLGDIDAELAAGWRSEWFDLHARLPESAR